MEANRIPDPNGALRQAENARREALIIAGLQAMRAAYEKTPLEGREKSIKVNAWGMALENLPTDEIEPAFRATLRRHKTSFLPTPADLLNCWRAEQNADCVESAAAYSPVAPTVNEQIEYGLLPALPGPDYSAFTPGGAVFEALKARLKPYDPAQQGVQALARTPDTRPAQAGLLKEQVILHILDRRCHYYAPEDAPELRASLVAYGRWLLAQFYESQLTLKLFREQWPIYQQSVRPGGDLIEADKASPGSSASATPRPLQPGVA